MQFTHAIVREPCERISEAISTAGLGKPDHSLALVQHQAYVEALNLCGLEITVLPPDNGFPDSTFVEDTTLLSRYFAVLTRPGAKSRRGEEVEMKAVVEGFYDNIFTINEPGTLEAGDVIAVDDHYYIGLSDRTNAEGALQLKRIIEDHGMSTSIIEVGNMLHLKSGISYLENSTFLAIDQFRMHPEFLHLNIIPVPAHEAYAANSLWVNGTVLVPQGFPITLDNIIHAGFRVIVLDMSEFMKADGGLSCLSLRF